MAVAILREWRAGACDARASLVETVGHAYGVVVGGRGVADPVGQGDGCDCAGYGA